MPGDQFMPWLSIGGGCWFVLSAMLKLDTWIWLSASLGGCATWWILTWRGMYYFFGRLVNVPLWVRAINYYQQIIYYGEENRSKKNRRKR